ncbi:hypothetical protein [Gordonia sp. MP11Mi]|uniref:Uncharacterized protein n=1 Tax=Gordonia sp. MP11Mi TaxID=3022769 RepID=A0AA97GVP4_9ACTN
MRSRSAILAVTALGIGLGAAVAPIATAGEASAKPATTCEMAYLNPNVAPLPLQATTVLTGTANGDKTMTITVKTDAVSLLGYQQHVSLTWKNIDNGRHRSQSWTRRVVGPNTTVRFPRIKTGVGLVDIHASVANTNSLTGQTTRDHCDAKQKAY